MMGAPTHSSRQFRFAALGIILLTVVIRLPSLLHPQPIDSEAMYSVVANQIVDGGRPYIDAVERKPPLLFWTYAAVFRIAGKFNWKALHVVALVWTLCAMAGLCAIGNELFDSNTGLIAALFYTVFQPWWTWKNLSFDGEMLMNLPIIWAWTIAFRRSASPVRPELFAACLPLVIGVILACRDKDEIWTGKTAERRALLGLLAVSAIGAAAGARFYPHYYVQLIPPLVLLAAPYYAQLWLRRMQPPNWLLRPRVTYAWLALTVIAFSIKHWTGLAPRRVPSETGRYLFTHSVPEDRIFVWGQTPEIYLDAHRRPACRYITTFPLTGYVFGGPIPGFDTRSRILPGAWSTLEQDFARHPATYIVDVQPDPKSAQYPVKNFPILAKLLAERYQPVVHTAEGVIYRMR